MKKILRNILMMAFIATSAIGFTSCEDERIASTLEGTCHIYGDHIPQRSNVVCQG